MWVRPRACVCVKQMAVLSIVMLRKTNVHIHARSLKRVIFRRGICSDAAAEIKELRAMPTGRDELLRVHFESRAPRRRQRVFRTKEDLMILRSTFHFPNVSFLRSRSYAAPMTGRRGRGVRLSDSNVFPFIHTRTRVPLYERNIYIYI